MGLTHSPTLCPLGLLSRLMSQSLLRVTAGLELMLQEGMGCGTDIGGM